MNLFTKNCTKLSTCFQRFTFTKNGIFTIKPLLRELKISNPKFWAGPF
jgi:hypothetical protein